MILTKTLVFDDAFIQALAPCMDLEVLKEKMDDLLSGVDEAPLMENVKAQLIDTLETDEELLLGSREENLAKLVERGREYLVSVLIGVGIQCYDHEDITTLAEAVLSNIGDETLSPAVVWEEPS